jgi:hypothetical protein
MGTASSTPKRRRYNPTRDHRVAGPPGLYRATVESIRAAIERDMNLTRTTKRTGLYICGLLTASESIETRYCHPNEKTIAKAIEREERTVQRAVAALKKARYFFVRPGSKRRGEANRYYPHGDHPKGAAIAPAPAAAAAATPAAAAAPANGARYTPTSHWAETPDDWRRWLIELYPAARNLPGWSTARGSRIVALAGAIQHDYGAGRAINLATLWREVEAF